MKAIIFILLTLSLSVYSQQCSFSINDYRAGVKRPLLIVNEGTSLKIKYPNVEGNIIMDAGDEIILVCARTEIPVDQNDNNVNIITTLVCNEGITFNNFGRVVNILEQTCEFWPIPSVFPVNGGCLQPANGPNHHILYDVNIRIGDNYLPLYKSCYDPMTCIVRYVTHQIQPYPKQIFHINEPSFDFKKGHLHNFCNVEKDYPQMQEIITFRERFPNTNYITPNNNQYLAKGKILEMFCMAKILKHFLLSSGHLAANADFVYLAEKYATYSVSIFLITFFYLMH